MVREGILKAGACGWPSETDDAEGDAALMRASVSSTSFKSGYDILCVAARRNVHQARSCLSVLDSWWCLVHPSQILGLVLLQV